jgi:hypothetical protein
MEENGGHKSFWTTLPGILTGLAAIIVAITGLIGGLVAGGVIGGPSEPPPPNQADASTGLQSFPLSNPAPTPAPLPTTESVPISVPSPTPPAALALATSTPAEPPLPTSPATVNCQDTPLIGSPTKDLPAGGASFIDAAPISPGLYLLKRSLEQNVYSYYKVSLKTEQLLSIKFRTPNIPYPYAGVSIYDGNGDLLKTDTIIGERSRKMTVDWAAAQGGEYYITLGNEFDSTAPDTIYLVCID